MYQLLGRSSGIQSRGAIWGRGTLVVSFGTTYFWQDNHISDAKYVGKKDGDLLFNDDGEEIAVEADNIVKTERVR